MAKLFLTGANGFIGTRLAARLARAGHNVVGLCGPAGPDGGRATPVADSIQPVVGDLLDPDTYTESLSSAHTVLHLAAATGRATRDRHFEVNLDGTRRLLESCKASGVERFLFVSTIAVTYSDLKRYPYADSKAQAERLVHESGIPYTIVRPTIVVGPGSPVLDGLVKLADAPVIPVFGNGQVKVQPIFVDDLIELIVDAAGEESLSGRVFEFGGPQTLSIEEFIQAIRLQRRGVPGTAVHIPLGLLLPALAALETVAYRFMPLTYGQLSAFRFDSTAEPNDLFEARRTELRDVPEMLALSVSG